MHPDALEILASTTRALLDAQSLQDGLQTITDAALRLTPADHASVRLCGEGPGLHVGARSGAGSERPPQAFRRGHGVVGWVAQTGQPVRLANGEADARFDRSLPVGFPVSSVMSIPIAAGGRTLGVLSMSAKEQNAFQPDDERVATLLANTAAHALRAAELQRMAITDAHTQAYNRGHLLPRLREEMEHATRHDRPLSLLLLDLDHFKRVNDRHGHAAGDEILRVFASRVRRTVRGADVLVRRGGEEFVLILPATGEAAALQIAERIRRDLAERPVGLAGGTRIRQTVSIGVAVWDRREPPDALDARADEAMYAAKRAGRNRVIVSEAQTAEEPSPRATMMRPLSRGRRTRRMAR